MDFVSDFEGGESTVTSAGFEQFDAVGKLAWAPVGTLPPDVDVGLVVSSEWHVVGTTAGKFQYQVHTVEVEPDPTPLGRLGRCRTVVEAPDPGWVEGMDPLEYVTARMAPFRDYAARQRAEWIRRPDPEAFWSKHVYAALAKPLSPDVFVAMAVC